MLVDCWQWDTDNEQMRIWDETHATDRYFFTDDTYRNTHIMCLKRLTSTFESSELFYVC